MKIFNRIYNYIAQVKPYKAKGCFNIGIFNRTRYDVYPKYCKYNWSINRWIFFSNKMSFNTKYLIKAIRYLKMK